MFKLDKYVNHKVHKLSGHFYQHFKVKESLSHLIDVSNNFCFIFYEPYQTKNHGNIYNKNCENMPFDLNSKSINDKTDF